LNKRLLCNHVLIHYWQQVKAKGFERFGVS
jgi:hypothetical protein